MYAKYIKRILDFILSLLAIVILSPVLLIVALLVRLKLGSPVIFKQKRPGLHEKIFTLYKFRTMTDDKDEDGNLLPDEIRLTKFGKLLRSTSLDELPELFNILKGDMAIVGPRPQLVRDMVFMSNEQRKRHTVRQGLTGLAQVSGRNNILWEDKLDWDLKYIDKITFLNDVKIIFQTVIKAIIKREGITDGENATAEDYGDYLLNKGAVKQAEYKVKQRKANQILDNSTLIEETEVMLDTSFSVAMCVYGGDNALFLDESLNSIFENTINPEQVVLIVDGPITETHEKVIAKYEDKLTIYRFQKNQGHGIARKKSIELCHNELIAVMDADDICSKNRFEFQINEFLKNPYLSLVGGQLAEFSGEITNIIGKRIVPTENDQIKRYLKKRCPFNQQTVMFKKSDILEVGNYQDWYCNEDYYLWIRLFLANKTFKNIDEFLVFFRVDDNMYKRRGGWKYFKSEFLLQNYMYKKNIISIPVWFSNNVKRFFLQILLPNKIRALIFRVIIRD